jgi:hypothetical protein
MEPLPQTFKCKEDVMFSIVMEGDTMRRLAGIYQAYRRLLAFPSLRKLEEVKYASNHELRQTCHAIKGAMGEMGQKAAFHALVDMLKQEQVEYHTAALLKEIGEENKKLLTLAAMTPASLAVIKKHLRKFDRKHYKVKGMKVTMEDLTLPQLPKATKEVKKLKKKAPYKERYFRGTR